MARPDLATALKRIAAADPPSKLAQLIVIAFMARANDRKTRDIHRSTWMSTAWRVGVVPVFAIEWSAAAEHRSLLAELELCADLVLFPNTSLAKKVRQWFGVALQRYPHATHIGKADMDTFVRAPRLLQGIRNAEVQAAGASLYYGAFVGADQCRGAPKDTGLSSDNSCLHHCCCPPAWCKGAEQLGVLTQECWSYAQGGLYIVSRALAQAVAPRLEALAHLPYDCEDATFGKLVQQVSLSTRVTHSVGNLNRYACVDEACLESQHEWYHMYLAAGPRSVQRIRKEEEARTRPILQKKKAVPAVSGAPSGTAPKSILRIESRTARLHGSKESKQSAVAVPPPKESLPYSDAQRCGDVALVTRTLPPPLCTGSQRTHCRLRLEGDLWARAGTTDLLVHGSVGVDYGGLLSGLAASLPPRTILEAGANVGFASALFARAFPNATIVAIEAQPANFAMLSLNTAHLRGVWPIHAALSNRSEQLIWKHGKRRAGKEYQYTVGRSATGNDGHAVAALHVHDALAAACLSADTPLDFVKIDVEGSEARVFAVDSDVRWLRRVGVIFIETHDDMATSSAEVSMRALATVRMRVMKMTFRSEHALLGCSASWPQGWCEQLCEQWRTHAQREGGYTQRRPARGRTNDPPRCMRL